MSVVADRIKNIHSVEGVNKIVAAIGIFFGVSQIDTVIAHLDQVPALLESLRVLVSTWIDEAGEIYLAVRGVLDIWRKKAEEGASL